MSVYVGTVFADGTNGHFPELFASADWIVPAWFKVNSDLDQNGVIGIFDVVACLGHYGEKCP